MTIMSHADKNNAFDMGSSRQPLPELQQNDKRRREIALQDLQIFKQQLN